MPLNPFLKLEFAGTFCYLARLFMAPGDGFFGTPGAVIWIFPSMNLHVALSVFVVVK